MSGDRPIRKILVANRGEIALRILRTARALGRRTVAVYSEADSAAPHVSFADEAVLLGGAALAESYLNAAALIAAARLTGADAVHPGYGLLSENAAFARACAAAGLTFIGPDPETIECMGDKRSARIAAQLAGVACVPGYDGDDQSDATLVREAARVGFPLMVKARAGGGGRGMRRVDEAGLLPQAIARARSEAKQAFGEDALILERVIEDARHVEVQIFGDRHGHIIHLGERDCSAQRRFQKIVEEAPSPAVGPELRARMGEVAVRVASSTGYVGAGTVEFLLAADGAFYFLEMNTRLQVEHPVTELVTGLDLVALQIRVAEGEPLSLTQSDVSLRGHAIEARLYAEDPARGFLPSAGTLRVLAWPQGEGVRVDHGLAPGLSVSTLYDPLLAKIVVHGATREDARQRLLAALRELCVLGVLTNRAFLCALLEHERFVRGEVTTCTVESSLQFPPAAPAPSRQTLACAAVLAVLRAEPELRFAHELRGLCTCVGLCWPVLFESDAGTFAVAVQPQGEPSRFRVQVDGQGVLVVVDSHQAHASVLVAQGVRLRLSHAWDGPLLWLQTREAAVVLRDVTHAPKTHAAQGSGHALAPMDGAVVEVPVQAGQAVVRGETLAVVCAMKLELRVCADVSGTVREVCAAVGDHVKARKLLVRVDPDPA